MARSFAEFIVMARDISRCLADERRLAHPVPLENGVLPFAQRIVEAAMGKKYPIEVSCRDANTNEAWSILIKRTDRAEIRYSRALNLCWRRFSVCKELTHLLFDTMDAHSTDYAAMAPLLASNTSTPSMVIPNHIASPFLSESLCVYGAAELLMPWPLRRELKAMAAAKKTDLEIAQHCKAPETWVAIMLRSPYSQISDHLNGEYDKKIGEDWSV